MKSLKESINEAFNINEAVNNSQKNSIALSKLTGVNDTFILKFIESNKIDSSKLLKAIKSKKVDAQDFNIALIGAPNNPIQLDIINTFKVNDKMVANSIALSKLTGVNDTFILKFIESNKIDSSKLLKAIKSKKVDAQDFNIALIGTPNNPIQLDIINKFQ